MRKRLSERFAAKAVNYGYRNPLDFVMDIKPFFPNIGIMSTSWSLFNTNREKPYVDLTLIKSFKRKGLLGLVGVKSPSLSEVTALIKGLTGYEPESTIRNAIGLPVGVTYGLSYGRNKENPSSVSIYLE